MRLKKFTLAAGTVVHIQAIPFYLVHDTTFEGHPGNVEMISVQDPDSPNYSLLSRAVSRPTWERKVLEFFRRILG